METTIAPQSRAESLPPNLVVSDITPAPAPSRSGGPETQAGTGATAPNGLAAASWGGPQSHQSHTPNAGWRGPNGNFSAPAPGISATQLPPGQSYPRTAVPAPQFHSSQPAAQPAPYNARQQYQYNVHPPAPAPAPAPLVGQPAKPQATRYVIKDPPSRINVPPIPRGSPSGYPSPTGDHALDNGKFVDDSTRLSCAIQQSVPEAVRRVIRDNWKKCLLGSEFHHAFVLNVAIHHSVPGTTRRAVSEFGAKMVADSKHELIKHFAAKDIDEVAEQILSVASNEFLDRCLEKRLLTIEAKPLIQALARAERLGYEPGDIVEADHERVIPNDNYKSPYLYTQQQQQQDLAQQHPPQQPGPKQPGPQQLGPQQPGPQQPAAYASTGQLHCSKCLRTFTHQSAYNLHTSKDVCSRQPPSAEGFKYSCQHCGQGFTTLTGLHYHHANKVCGDFTGYAPPVRGPGRPAKVRTSTGSVPGTISPAAPAHSQHAAAAVAAAAQSTPTAGDPYAHLTPEQFESMQEELREAEVKYAARIRESESIPDPEERRHKLEGLRNSFGTKQSMVRKKYGVRLRERRTKAEIQAERERMGLSSAPSSQPGRSIVPARRSLDTANEAATPTPTRSNTGSRWTAANGAAVAGAPNAESHNSKRRRIEDGEDDVAASNQTPSTAAAGDALQKRVAASDMGGLGASAATVAHHDPTLPDATSSSQSKPAATYQQAGARVEIHLPSRSASNTPRGSSNADAASQGRGRSSSKTPSRVPSRSPSDAKHLTIEDDDSDSDSDEDIPAKLPANVRQTLTPNARLGA